VGHAEGNGQHEISVIVNTAEDIWISGNHISPDLDTIMYLFAGILNTDSWWGVRNDTFTTHDEITRLGMDEFIAIGDKDRAVHIVRGRMMRDGMRLTNVTKFLWLGVRQNASMTDTEVTTQIKTALGLIHFQEYWVRAKGKIEIELVVRSYKNPPVATEEGLAVIEASEAVVIGPSNPITSISPILACEGMTQAIRTGNNCQSFPGNSPFNGLRRLMQAAGFEPNSQGTLECYEGITDIFVQDIRDSVRIDNSVRFDTLMTSEEKSVALAREILSLAKRG
jgi:LPPG:FO 2-phospho-L-lactate transferase